MDWEPMDSAPKDGTSILTYPHYRVTFWTPDECLTPSGGGWAGTWDDYLEAYSEIRPTHWVELPPPPKVAP